MPITIIASATNTGITDTTDIRVTAHAITDITIAGIGTTGIIIGSITTATGGVSHTSADF